MGENILYHVNERKTSDDNTSQNISVEKLMGDFMNKTVYVENNNDMVYIYRLEYEINYTVKMLTQILEYYKICKRKLKKQDMISKIVEFETDVQNIEMVERRRMFWQYIAELKQDEYMSKYIIC